MTSPVNGLGLFEIVKRMGEGRSLILWLCVGTGPHLPGRARGQGWAARAFPHNAWRIDWFHGSLFDRI